MDNNTFDQDEALELLKKLTHKDFLDIGLHQVAYIKRVDDDEEKGGYAVHAADGSQISVMQSYDMAMATIKVNDLFPVTVH